MDKPFHTKLSCMRDTNDIYFKNLHEKLSSYTIQTILKSVEVFELTQAVAYRQLDFVFSFAQHLPPS